MVKTFHDRNPSSGGSPEPVNAPVEPLPGGSLFAAMEARRQADRADAPPPSAEATPSPRPLFRPTVQSQVDPSLKAAVEQAITDLKLDDFSFGDNEISRIIQLRDDIRLDDPLYISEFGADLGKFSDNILDRLGELSNSRFPEQIRQYLDGILQLTRKVNLDALRSGGKGGLFFGLFTRGITDKSGFRHLEMDVSSLTSRCLEKLKLLKQSQQAFVELLDKNELQFRAITAQMVAGQLRLADERARLAQTPAESGDFFVRQARQDLEDALQRFDRRLHNLSLLRHTVLLRMSQLRLEQKNIHALIDQTHETITLVIPTWRQQVMALFSVSTGEGHAELFARLESTHLALQERLQAIKPQG